MRVERDREREGERERKRERERERKRERGRVRERNREEGSDHLLYTVPSLAPYVVICFLFFILASTSSIDCSVDFSGTFFGLLTSSDLERNGLFGFLTPGEEEAFSFSFSLCLS